MPFFFGKTEAAGEFKFVGGRVVCLAQMSEEAIAKSHEKLKGGARAVLSLLA